MFVDFIGDDALPPSDEGGGNRMVDGGRDPLLNKNLSQKANSVYLSKLSPNSRWLFSLISISAQWSSVFP